MDKKKRFLRIGFAVVIFVLAFTAYWLVKDKIFRPKPKIAIVLDDWGYGLSNLPVLYEIKRPIAVAVIPDLKYSKKIALDAGKNGYEILLHLPLESKGGRNAEPGTICCLMGSDEILRRFKKALAGVPGASGVNNHQGSKATESRYVMGTVLPRVKKEGLFFLDSFTTGKSICPEICGRIGLRWAKRDVFLDLPASKLKGKELDGYIRKQLHELADVAIKKGRAIGIGHDRKATLKAIKDAVPELEKRGVKFVRVSDIVSQNHTEGPKDR